METATNKSVGNLNSLLNYIPKSIFLYLLKPNFSGFFEV